MQKIKSSIKKRFIFNKKLKFTQSNKKHNMRKRSKRQLNNQGGIIRIANIELKRKIFGNFSKKI